MWRSLEEKQDREGWQVAGRLEEKGEGREPTVTFPLEMGLEL